MKFGDAATFINKDCTVLFGNILIVPFLGSALGYFIAVCSLGWGNLVSFDWNDLPVGREFDGKCLKNVKSPTPCPASPPPPPPPPAGFTLIGASFKRSMLPCFGSRNDKGEIASLQGLQEYGNIAFLNGCLYLADTEYQ